MLMKGISKIKGRIMLDEYNEIDYVRISITTGVI